MDTPLAAPGRTGGRLRRVLLAAIAALCLSAVAVPVATADEATAIGGSFREHSFKLLGQQVAGNDTIVQRSLKGNVKGCFDGFGDAVERVTLHSDGSGEVTGQILFTGCVVGRCGTALLAFEGSSADSQFFDGRFTVVSGSGELENLGGKGTFFHAPSGTYQGTVRFERLAREGATQRTPLESHLAALHRRPDARGPGRRNRRGPGRRAGAGVPYPVST